MAFRHKHHSLTIAEGGSLADQGVAHSVGVVHAKIRGALRTVSQVALGLVQLQLPAEKILVAAAERTVGKVLLQADGAAVIDAAVHDTDQRVVNEDHRVVQASQTVTAFRHVGAVVKAPGRDAL